MLLTDINSAATTNSTNSMMPLISVIEPPQQPATKVGSCCNGGVSNTTTLFAVAVASVPTTSAILATTGSNLRSMRTVSMLLPALPRSELSTYIHICFCCCRRGLCNIYHHLLQQLRYVNFYICRRWWRRRLRRSVLSLSSAVCCCSAPPRRPLGGQHRRAQLAWPGGHFYRKCGLCGVARGCSLRPGSTRCVAVTLLAIGRGGACSCCSRRQNELVGGGDAREGACASHLPYAHEDRLRMLCAREEQQR